MDKNRLIVLTDIATGFELDDIESLVRLLLYANEIDIEGLIACTSCWYPHAGKDVNLALIYNVLKAYEDVYVNLKVHHNDYPEPESLRACVARGIDIFGKAYGDGWGTTELDENPGVKLIIEAIERDDERPLWIALWGGANTLAQSLDKIARTHTREEMDILLSKIRIYGISDQDNASYWIRSRYGDKLFYIVSPSPGERSGDQFYKYATWPGISGDDFMHGSENGIDGGGFTGAEQKLISRKWLEENVINHGPMGQVYPMYPFLMEGDSPSFMNLIPNGLHYPERPDFGGWGGRYKRLIPDESITGTKEIYPIWTSVADKVRGIDGEVHVSPQASIWRWRLEFQNDFAARMDWTICPDYHIANHHPIAKMNYGEIHYIKSGQIIHLDGSESMDPDGHNLCFNWQHYPEIGEQVEEILIEGFDKARASFVVPELEANAELHIILRVTNDGTPNLCNYARVRFIHK